MTFTRVTDIRVGEHGSLYSTLPGGVNGERVFAARPKYPR